MAEKKEFKLGCLICGEEKGLAKVETIWKGPASTEFAEDLSFSEPCRELKGGVFFDYNIEKLTWTKKKTLESAPGWVLLEINTLKSNLVFVCNDCLSNPKKEESRQVILRAKEKIILRTLKDREEESVVSHQKHIDEEKKEIRQAVQRSKKIQERLESLDK